MYSWVKKVDKTFFNTKISENCSNILIIILEILHDFTRGFQLKYIFYVHLKS